MMANLNNVHPTKQPYIETDLFTPFTTTEEAWFWFMKALAAQQDGAKPRKGLGLQSRPCEPSDIQKIVERLHQRRVLLLDHIRVLVHYGRRDIPPNPRRSYEEKAYLLWQQALQQLEPVFRGKGIIA